MKKSRKVTVLDIAQALNVSIGTVDRALNGRPGIKEETKRKVLEKAEELNYKVNKVAQSLSRKQPILLGAVVPNRDTSMKYFWDDVLAGIKRAADELKDFKTEVLIRVVDSIDFVPEINAVNDLVQKGISGLAICPFHKSELNKVINDITDKGIPVVTVGTDAPESRRLTSIGTDSYNTGEIAAELIAKFMNFKGKVAILTGFRTITDNEEKVRAFCNTLGVIAPKIKITGIYETAEKEELGYSYALEAIKETPSLTGMYVSTANSIGVCRALKDAGKNNSIKVITTDIFPGNMGYIRDGTISASIYQDPFRQGYRSVQTLYESLITGKSFPNVCYIKPEIVMNYNLGFYENLR